MKYYYTIIGILLVLIILIYFKDNFTNKNSTPPTILLRCDDIGITNTVNDAIERIAELKIPISASVIVNSSYYDQAIEILKKNPQISVGVHLVFTSEWENGRWKPLLPKEKVMSLVDSNGYFYPSRIALLNGKPDSFQIEAEAEAQIKKILVSGVKVDYIDSHMFFLYSNNNNKILKRLGKKYNLIVSEMNNELLLNDMFTAESDQKLNKYIGILSDLENGETYIIVLHPASNPDELNAMKDINKPFFTKNGDNRFKEFCAIISEEASQTITQNNIKLETYSTLFSTKQK